ncbi:MAG: RagB/SusD family nutrient uptake outer membrane protein [Chitinophagales bacterium]
MNRLSDIRKWTPVILMLFITGVSCTKLDVKTYSSIPSSTFWKTAAEISAGKAPAYANLPNVVGHSSPGYTCENASDEMVYPVRGSDWGDGGYWTEMFFHQEDKNDLHGNMNGCWSPLFSGAGNCNFVIYTLNNLPSGTDVTLDADIAEMTGLRSWYYLKAMDMFGNIPYVTNFKVDPSTVTNIPRAAVFDSLEKDLIAAIPNLSPAVDATTYGKVNKWTAFATLARMYLNSSVYTAGPNLPYQPGVRKDAECIAMCDSIINNGPFSLESDYYDCFYGINNTSAENIFVVPFFDNSPTIQGNGLVQASIEFNSALTFGIPCCNYGNNGASTTTEFYKYFDTSSTYTNNVVQINGRTVHQRLRTFNDQRAGQYLIGQQFQGDGITNYPPYKNWVVDNDDVCCTYGDANQVASEKATTKIGDYYNSIYTPTIIYASMTEFNNPAATFRHAGLKNIKYWPQQGPNTNGGMGNAFVVFRLADIYLMRAEAEYYNGDLADALNDFNIVRMRAYSNNPAFNWTLADLTPANILAERGRELAWEDVRRSDLIRFEMNTGTRYYTGARTYPPKPADAADGHNMLYPIPLQQINTNKNLKQNPGY